MEQTTNKLIQENNVDIVSKMLVDDIINQSIEELEEEEPEKNNFAINNRIYYKQ